jgi:thymidylate synthase (FAD)
MADAIHRVELFEHGFIELIDHMGDDLAIANNAKVSFNRFITREEYDADPEVRQHVHGLVDFLVRKRHGSPLERPVFTFRWKAPIFLMREIHRHRLASLNEESMRYSIKEHAEVYVPAPEAVRTQVGRPGAYTFEPITDTAVVEEAISKIELSQHFAFRTYRELVDMGVAKELARTVIPVGMFSTMIWQANLRSIMNFLALRNHDEAQFEIQQYATAMEEMVTAVCPVAMEAFNKHGRMVP